MGLTPMRRQPRLLVPRIARPHDDAVAFQFLRSVASLSKQENQKEADKKNKDTENDNKSWKHPSRPIREAHGLGPFFMANAHFHRFAPLLRADARLLLRCQWIAAYFGFALSKLPEWIADDMLLMTEVGCLLRR